MSLRKICLSLLSSFFCFTSFSSANTKVSLLEKIQCIELFQEDSILLLDSKQAATANRILSIARKLQRAPSDEARNNTQLSEYKDDINQIRQVLKEVLTEIKTVQDTFSELLGESYRSSNDKRLSKALADFNQQNAYLGLGPIIGPIYTADLTFILKEILDVIDEDEVGKAGPSYKVTVYLSYLVPRILAKLMGLRTAIYKPLRPTIEDFSRHYDVPITKVAISNLVSRPTYLIRTLYNFFYNDVYSIHYFFSLDIWEPPPGRFGRANYLHPRLQDLLDFPRRTIIATIDNMATRVHHERSSIVMVPYFADEAMDPAVMAELSLHNVAIRQSRIHAIQQIGVDGGYMPVDPENFADHDSRHRSRIWSLDINRLHKFTRIYREALLMHKPEWIPLLRVLIGYFHHEIGLDISNLSCLVSSLYKNGVEVNSLSSHKHMSTRMNNPLDFKDEVVTPLFNRDWFKFLEFLHLINEEMALCQR